MITKRTKRPLADPKRSKYRGVCWNRRNYRWQAAINLKGTYKYLGSYLKEEDAARAFDKEAIIIRGPKRTTRVNFEASRHEYGSLYKSNEGTLEAPLCPPVYTAPVTTGCSIPTPPCQLQLPQPSA